jgi:3-oxoacyl-[acyl-carrier protein] reductase
MLWKTDETAAAAGHPLNKLGEPDDVAEAIVFLCAAGWVTGVVLSVDGGAAGASAGLA